MPSPPGGGAGGHGSKTEGVSVILGRTHWVGGKVPGIGPPPAPERPAQRPRPGQALTARDRRVGPRSDAALCSARLMVIRTHTPCCASSANRRPPPWSGHPLL